MPAITSTTSEPTDPDRSPPRRPVLRPGTHVLRRSADELQVGLDPRRAVVLPDRDPYRATLGALASPAGSAQAYDGTTLALLHEAGLLVDADVVLPLVPTGPAAAGRLARADVASLAAAGGDRVTQALADRRRCDVEVSTAGDPAAHAVAERLVALLVAAGCTATLLDPDPSTATPTRPRISTRTATRRDPGSGRARTRSPRPVVAALVVVGEPEREYVDEWMREGTPHVLLRLTEGQVLLGPFVVPGVTACLRCMDAHHTDIDPAWPLLVTQYAAAVSRIREDSLPEPVDSLLANLAAAWTARDLVSYLEGHSASTTSAILRLDGVLSSLEAQTWARHPACGCTWAET